MQDTSRPTRKVSWQTKGKRVTMLAEMAVRQRQVAERLSQLREQHELTQEQAAQKVGITVRQWQRWEDGTSMPHARNLKNVADAFKVKVTDFFDEAELERISGGVGGELDIRRSLTELHRKMDRILEVIAPEDEEVAEANRIVSGIEAQLDKDASKAASKTKNSATH